MFVLFYSMFIDSSKGEIPTLTWEIFERRKGIFIPNQYVARVFDTKIDYAFQCLGLNLMVVNLKIGYTNTYYSLLGFGF